MKAHRTRRNSKDSLADKGLACRGRIWLQKNGATFLGTGRVVLLERIREHGSIAKAARSMEMSYKHAWDLVDSMNRQAGEPMVVTSKGGRGGGGTRLTECGEKAIAAFWALQERFHRFLEAETSELDL
ncbi:winged helix-turn-helix domain-containing protein [Desulfolithobacter dissulfuricans]|uniref:winged helix-turn-helix domain-containing protein n=1 Tax=Desulfolithobacter dissulfuricans TaxID=2795293 RepID=UPI0022786D7B|nr:LysR family transcriptional regulator [Desulfolithobacter dissulfuricans]